MQTNPAVEQNENIKWSESPWNQSLCRKEFALMIYVECTLKYLEQSSQRCNSTFESFACA